MIPDHPERLQPADEPPSLRKPVIRIGMAVFALAVVGGVWANGKAGGWW